MGICAKDFSNLPKKKVKGFNYVKKIYMRGTTHHLHEITILVPHRIHHHQSNPLR